MENKYVKVMYGTTSGADKNLEYKIDVVNIADNWNPNASSGEECRKCKIRGCYYYI